MGELRFNQAVWLHSLLPELLEYHASGSKTFLRGELGQREGQRSYLKVQPLAVRLALGGTKDICSKISPACPAESEFIL